MTRYFRFALFALLIPLGACASPEHQLRAGLVDAGLSQDLSACMAHDMASRLSVTQLLRLRDLSRVGGDDRARTSIDRYLHQVRGLKDTELLIVTTKAAARCALGL